MDDSVGESAAYFRAGTPVPDDELIALSTAARAGGQRWVHIAVAGGVTTIRDTDGIVSLPSGRIRRTGAGLLYRATQCAVERVVGSRSYPRLTWPCASCGRPLTPNARVGRRAYHRALAGQSRRSARLGPQLADGVAIAGRTMRV